MARRKSRLPPQPGERLVTFKEAYERLGLHRQTLEHHLGKELPDGEVFEPDYRSGPHRYFRESKVEAFRQAYLNQEMLSIDEIAVKFGINPKRVAYHFRWKRKVEPDGYRGHAMVYGPEKVHMIANAEGWTVSPPLGGKEETTAPSRLSVA